MWLFDVISVREEIRYLMNKSYYESIDGLRALAVSLVVLFHVDIERLPLIIGSGAGRRKSEPND